MEVDLLRNYPKSKRDTSARKSVMSDDVKAIARQYGKDFFDGDRLYGYGGFHYHPRFWQPVIPDLIQHYDITPGSLVLDIGCAKGFMLYDLQEALPGIGLTGIDISEYAVTHAKPEIKDKLMIGDAVDLPFNDDSFDVVFSINTVHNLDEDDCAKALQEIMRVSRGKAFVTVDAYRNAEEQQRMLEWALTAKTIMHVDDWKAFFNKVGYTGDYYWFIP
jgi:ubiquinone/menaquinone biosynthesis C-methylase UbiE